MTKQKLTKSEIGIFLVIATYALVLTHALYLDDQKSIPSTVNEKLRIEMDYPFPNHVQAIRCAKWVIEKGHTCNISFYDSFNLKPIKVEISENNENVVFLDFNFDIFVNGDTYNKYFMVTTDLEKYHYKKDTPQNFNSMLQRIWEKARPQVYRAEKKNS